jgi:hypothetical protein
MHPIDLLTALQPFSAQITAGAGALLKQCDRFLDINSREATTPRELTITSYLGRVTFWMKSFSKLGDLSDNQAIGAGSRALLEIVTDTLFVHGDRTGYVAAQIDAWSRSARFDAAQKLIAYYREKPPLPSRFSEIASTPATVRDKVLMDRVFLLWCRDIRKERDRLKHPMNWRADLSDQCKTLDEAPACAACQADFGLRRYYVENNKMTCWLVHGSGFAAFGSDQAGWARDAARMIHNAWTLARLVFNVVQHEFSHYDPHIATLYDAAVASVREGQVFFQAAYDRPI